MFIAIGYKDWFDDDIPVDTIFVGGSRISTEYLFDQCRLLAEQEFADFVDSHDTVEWKDTHRLTLDLATMEEKFSTEKKLSDLFNYAGMLSFLMSIPLKGAYHLQRGVYFEIYEV